MIALYLLAAAAAIVLLVSWICFSMAFHVPPSRHLTDEGEVHLPSGSIYVPYHDRMRQWALEKRALPQRHVTITSHDGLKLWASFFEFAPGAPVELMFCKRVHELLPDSFTSFKNSSMFFSLRASNCFLTRLFSL